MRRFTFRLACFLCFLLNGTTKAQEYVYFWKGNTIVDFYSVETIDSISFWLPEGFIDPDAEFGITGGEIGKNHFFYEVTTPKQNDSYVHGAVLKSYHDLLFELYYGATPESATQEQLVELYDAMGLLYGESGTGSALYQRNDFTDNPENSVMHEVLAGQEYQLFAFDKLYDLPNNIVSTTITTNQPGVSSAKIYLNDINIDHGSVSVTIDADSEILYFYTAYSYKNLLDTYIEDKGLEHTTFLYGQRTNKDGFNKPNVWPIYDDQIYSLYVIGVDANGDQVIVQREFDRSMVSSDAKFISLENSSVTDNECFFTAKMGPKESITNAVVSKFDNAQMASDLIYAGQSIEDVILLGTSIVDITEAITSSGLAPLQFTNYPNRWNCVILFAEYNDGTKMARYDEYWPEEGERLWEEILPGSRAAAGRKARKEPACFNSLTQQENKSAAETLEEKVSLIKSKK